MTHVGRFMFLLCFLTVEDGVLSARLMHDMWYDIYLCGL